MRLLHTKELRFGEFFDHQIPKYAILSHRWGDEEISFQELAAVIEMPPSEIDTLLSHPRILGSGLDKIIRFRTNVAQFFDWVWIDTCCINKESSAELSEAINSMYRWYEGARICNVYLSDVVWEGPGGEDQVLDESDLEHFRNSQWFTRGWTLQELLAPREVLFFDKNWKYIATRHNIALSSAICKVTSIQPEFITGVKPISEACVAKKMSWISMRQTSRTEDMAYCMLGVFGVNMPLLYGEGRKAFLRLQLELIRKDDDDSIFAWIMKAGSTVPLSWVEFNHLGLLAPWPTCFSNSHNFLAYPRNRRVEERPPYTMTNQGLQIQNARVVTWRPSGNSGNVILQLNCYMESSDDSVLPFIIEVIRESPLLDKYWRRADNSKLYVNIDHFETELWLTPLYIRQDGM